MNMLLFYIFLLIGFSESFEHEISIDEETPIGTVILDLNRLPSSSSTASVIKYHFLDGSPLLSFNATTNLIKVSKRIDRDTLCLSDDLCPGCYLSMKLYNISSRDTFVIRFKIKDINDNQPTFSSNTYSISLTENNIPGIKLRLPKAEDIDCSMNGVYTYELAYMYNNHIIKSVLSTFQSMNHMKTTNNNNYYQPFYLVYDANSELYLVVNISLDRELQPEYMFTVTVNDQKYTASTRLKLTVLDVNDHHPKFSQSIYSLNISHMTPIGTILTKVTAHDADTEENARISYSLISVDGLQLGLNGKSDLFQLNSLTGELLLISKINYTDSKNIFKLIIGASDGSNNAIPALCTVYINVYYDISKDNKSLIQITFGSNRASENSTEVYIPENLPNATFIAYIKSDHHIQIQCNEGVLLQKLPENSFTLLTDGSYDREKRSSYNVLLRNRNIERNLKIIVTDVNDCKPVWDKEKADIDMDLYDLNNPIKLRLNATDSDENSRTAFRKSNSSWPLWVTLTSDELIIDCTSSQNDSVSSCWLDVSNGEVLFDVDAYDVDDKNLSSTLKVRLYRSSKDPEASKPRHSNFYDVLQWLNQDYLLIVIICLVIILFIIATTLIIIYYRRESNEKPSSIITNIIDDNSTKQKIIQTSSSEQTSSAGSLYGSDKSENITVETSDMFLFSPRRTATLMTHPPTDNLTNRLFHSIQNDLSLLTETNHHMTSARGTYV